MGVSSTLYCYECGAALTTQATYCHVCNYRVGTVSSVHSALPAGSPPSSPPPPLLPLLSQSTGPLLPRTVLNNRYVILEKVGEGGFGLVYKARDQYHRGRLVAVKQINLSTLSPKEMIEATDSYNREISLLPRLHHKNLPCFYDHFTDPAHWYVVMDFIDGVTLEEYLQKRRGKRLPLKQVREIGLVLCDVLLYLHSQHPAIIFRDVKPANIMRTRTGQYYLIDFGIARQYVSGKSRDTGPLGSPGYAAPEQYGTAQTDERTDVYGLGATLQTLLTGCDPTELLTNRRAQKRLTKAPARLRTLLEQMLQSEATRRPATLLEVRYRLENVAFEGFFIRAARKALSLVRWIFGRYFILWLASCAMAWFLAVSRSPQTLQYFILLLPLLLSVGFYTFNEEVDGRLKPLSRDEIISLVLTAGRRATLPVFALTLFCWLYYQGYEATLIFGWMGIYFLYYFLIAAIVLAFFFYSLFKLLKQVYLISQKRSGRVVPKKQPRQSQRHPQKKVPLPLQQRMRIP